MLRLTLFKHSKDRYTTIQLKRLQHVGALAEQAGLFIWDDATLREVFKNLAALRGLPDPVDALERLLMEDTNRRMQEHRARLDGDGTNGNP